MCGRVTVRASGEAFARELGFSLEADAGPPGPRFNLAPTQVIPVVLNVAPTRLQWVRWGLVPSWSKGLGSKRALVNARAESLSDKPSFREALKARRCLVLVDGFYEWRREGSARVPFHVQRRGGRPMALAGLWDTWRAPSGAVVKSCAVITTPPNPLLAPLHDRMPRIFTPEEAQRWLVEGTSELLGISPVDDLELRPVASRVNDVGFDGPECLDAAPPRPTTLDLFPT